MGSSVTIKSKFLKPKSVINKRWLIRFLFIVGVLAIAWFQILLFPSEPGYLIGPLPLAIGVSIYSCFKVIQPLSWHQSRGLNEVLFSLDLSVAAALIFLTGGIHSPFILYTLAPVLYAAMMLRRRYTLAIAAITVAYVLVAYSIHSTPSSMDTLAEVNDFPIYLVALSLTAILPYSINLTDAQNLKLMAIQSERQKLAREIHDNLCQTIYGLRWQIQMLHEWINQPIIPGSED